MDSSFVVILLSQHVALLVAVWTQYGIENQKCASDGCSIVSSQDECEISAANAGHDFYSWDVSRKCCSTHSSCNSPIVTNNPWKMYKNPSVSAPSPSPTPTPTPGPDTLQRGVTYYSDNTICFEAEHGVPKIASEHKKVWTSVEKGGRTGFLYNDKGKQQGNEYTDSLIDKAGAMYFSINVPKARKWKLFCFSKQGGTTHHANDFWFKVENTKGKSAHGKKWSLWHKVFKYGDTKATWKTQHRDMAIQLLSI
jgi:hypothetical protein